MTAPNLDDAECLSVLLQSEGFLSAAALLRQIPQFRAQVSEQIATLQQRVLVQSERIEGLERQNAEFRDQLESFQEDEQ